MDHYSFDRELSFRDVLAIIGKVGTLARAHAAILFAGAAIGVTFGIYLAAKVPRHFRSSVTMIPMAPQAQQSNARSILLAQTEPAGTGGVISAQLFSEVMRTHEYRVAIATTVVEQRGDGAQITVADVLAGCAGLRRAADACDQATVISVFELADHFARTENTTGSLFRERPVQVLPSTESLLKKLEQGLRLFVKGNGAIEVEAIMPDSILAATVAQSAAKTLIAFMRRFAERKANEQLQFIDSELTASRIRYEDAQRRLAIFVDANRSASTAVAQIERRRLEREEALAFELLQRFSREREEVRLERADGTPSYTVLDRSRIPLQPEARGRLKTIGSWFAFGMLLSMAVIGVRYLRRRIRPRA